jgi:hypothetical protein
VADPSSGWINVTHGLFAPVAVVFSYRPTFIVGTVSPQGASVAIDGVLQAVTDGTFNDSVLPGAHTLVVNDTGYTPQTIHVNATAGNYTVVHVRLIPLPSPGSVSTTNTSSTGLSSVELGALIAVIGVAIAAGIGLLIWRRTKNP